MFESVNRQTNRLTDRQTPTRLVYYKLTYGYTFIIQCRKQRYMYLRRSGGIGVFIRDDIYQHISVKETESDYMFWVKLSKIRGPMVM